MQPGEVFADRFLLVKELGRGSMGVVWRAVDQRLDRVVAVKMLQLVGGHATRESVERLRREGKAVARLHHPHVADVYDVGEHEGSPFLVLELLAGPDLETLLERHPGGLPVEEAAEYAAQAVEGLAAAHAAGVIHRDVKPSNLILDGHGKIRVCDFGVARLEGATAGLSATGMALGTPYYMAPEQISGETITAAADVYGLGATLFHLLTGRVPFPGDSLRAILGQHLYKDPPAASSLRPDIPASVDAYVRALLAKDPAGRPPAGGIAVRLRTLHTRQDRVLTLLTRAEQAAQSIVNPSYQGHFLRSLAQEMAAQDPAEAERIARTITDLSEQRYALQDIAKVIARQDLAEAERITRSVPAQSTYQAEALAYLAGFLAGENQNLAQAERIARSIPDPYHRTSALVRIAEMTAARDPARADTQLKEAEHLARTIPDPYHRAFSIAVIAVAEADQSPGRAAALLTEIPRLIEAITGPDDRIYGGMWIAKTLAEVFPGEAEQIVNTIQPAKASQQAQAYTDIAKVIASRHPARAMALLSTAQRAARSVTDPDYRASLLERAVEVLADLNLAEARQAARAITVPAQKAGATAAVARAAAGQDPRLAATLLAEAERIARTITEPIARAAALNRIATTMSTINPAEAERIARTITDPHHQKWALREIVESMSKTDLAGAQCAASIVAAPRDQAELLRNIVMEIAGRDPAEAERIARTITDPYYRTWAFTAVAHAIAGQDPGQADARLIEAEHFASTVSDPRDQAIVLLAIAKAMSGSLSRGQS
jgi:serine/threonine protein kinase